jgi:hypothetical protein
MSQSPYNIFLSCGTPHTKAQEDFLSAIESHLRSHDCIPQTVGRSVFSVRQPVQSSRDLIASCRGVVVVAFERTRILKALDKPGSSEQKEVANESHPTVWNHMEAAMAYAQEVPMLTIVQKGLRRQGMLSDRFEWMALESDLSPTLIATEPFQQIFREWLALVHARGTKLARADIDPASLTVGQLLALLKASQMWALIVAAFGVLSGVFVIAMKIGQAFPHHV